MSNEPDVPKPAATEAKPGARLKEVAGFEIIGKLGQGGMGAVFKARQKSLDRIVALKVLPPSIAKDANFIERFQREARASAKLNHPNIVQGIDVGKDPASGLWYFAMEYVDGPSLKNVLQEQRVIPQERALAIAREVAKALETIAAHKMVHRDIKPDNILLTQRGETKLADLGLAKQLNEDASLTQSGQAIGTPHYMAPEQVRGNFEGCDIRTDIYALGATLFHLVTGHPPFSGETSAVIMSKHLTESVPKANKVNPAVSESCSRLIEKMMQKKIDQRIQTPADLVLQIEKILKGETFGTPLTGAHKPTAPRLSSTDRKRETETPKSKVNPLLIAAGAVVLLAIVGFALKSSGTPAPGVVVAPLPKPHATPTGTPAVKLEVIAKAPVVKAPTGNPDELFKAAAEFEQKNPDAFDDAAQRYHKAGQVAKGTPREAEFQDKVDDALTALQTRHLAVADKAWAAAEVKAAEFVTAENYDAAISAYQALIPKLPMLKEKSEEKLKLLNQEAKDKIVVIAKKVGAFAADAEPAEGLQALEEAEKITYTPTQVLVVALKKKLTEDLANVAELKQKKAALGATKRLGEVLEKFDQALLVSRDLSAAADVAAAAKKDATLAPAEKMVSAMGEVMSAFDEAARYDTDQASKLASQKAELELITGVIHKGIIAKVQDGTISLKIDFGGGASGEKKVKISDLTDSCRKKLFPPFTPKTEAQHVAHSYTCLAKGNVDFAGVVEHLAQAPDFALTPHCRELAEKIKLEKQKALAEAGAPAAWTDLQARSTVKLTDADAKILKERLARFELEFGATQYAATIKDKLAALKLKLAKLAAPNLVLNGGFEKGALEGWIKAGGTLSGELTTEHSHLGKNAYYCNIQPDYNTTLSQTIAVEPQNEYRMSCWIKHLKGTLDMARGGLFVLEEGETDRREVEGHWAPLLLKAKLGEWVHVETRFTPQTANVKVELFLRQRSKADDRYHMIVDDIEIARTSSDKPQLPAVVVPDMFKAMGLVFATGPNEPSGTTREWLSSAAAVEKGLVTIVTDSGMKAMQFETSYVAYPASDAVKAISASGSAFVWVKVNKPQPPWSGMLMRGDMGPGAKGHCDFSLFLNNDKFVAFFNYPESTLPGVDGKSVFSSKRTITNGKWTMLGVTWDGKTINIWVNGEKDNTYNSTTTPMIRPLPEIIALGCDPAGSPEYFNGLLSMAMIYNRALTELEIKSLYLISNIQGK